jgi:hypothetical protein
MLHPKRNDIASSILDYKGKWYSSASLLFLFRIEYHTDTIVRFVVKLSAAQFAKFNETGLYKNFRLQETFKLKNMVLFDHSGILHRYF